MEEWEAAVLHRQPFTLIFGGPPGDVLHQGLHTLEVEGGPAFQLYIIPVQTPAPGPPRAIRLSSTPNLFGNK